MSGTVATEFAVVGSGVAGVLVAHELVSAGKEVLLVERGADKPHQLQVLDGAHEALVSTAAHNHEPHPETPEDVWEYVYGVGGSGLHWGGVTPRLLPADFEIRSRYGVGRDWPLTYDALEPFYVQAERALGVAGGPNELFGEAYRPPLPPHPPSALDRLIGRYLAPYATMPQARPTRSIGGRPACCGSGRCRLCPVDAKYTPLHTLDLIRSNPLLALRDRCVVARLRPRRGGDWRLECRTASGEHLEILAQTVVVAASGIENAAILLRSRLGGDDVGRWLCDHFYASFDIEVARPYEAGHGSTIATGISYAWADGDWRRDRASQLVLPDNLGALYGVDFVDGIAAGRRGIELQRRIIDGYQRRVRLDVSAEDLPQPGRRVELSPNRDGLGVPLNRVRYSPDSEYVQRARVVIRRELEERLRPLGGRILRESTYGGGHQIGTCRMGDGDGVVDATLELHGAPNVYVVGSSAFPSYSAAHPTLTVAALAIRLGQMLASR